jgi:hypothetical protein
MPNLLLIASLPDKMVGSIYDNLGVLSVFYFISADMLVASLVSAISFKKFVSWKKTYSGHSTA